MALPSPILLIPPMEIELVEANPVLGVVDLAIRNVEQVLEIGGWGLIGIRNDLKLVKMQMESMRYVLRDAGARKHREPPLKSRWVGDVVALAYDLNKCVRCLSSWVESSSSYHQESINSEKTIEIELRLEVGLDMQVLKERAIELNSASCDVKSQIPRVQSEIISSRNRGINIDHSGSIGGSSIASSRLMSHVLSKDGTFRYSEIFEHPEDYDGSSPYYNWICDSFFHMYKIVVYIITNS